jgi:antitoxin MazE
MRVKAAKWGNSLAVRLPKEAVRALNAAPGLDLEMTVASGRLEIVPVKPDRFSLEWMVAEARRLGPEHEPETVDWGPDLGSEIIDDEWSRGELPPPKFLDGD